MKTYIDYDNIIQSDTKETWKTEDNEYYDMEYDLKVNKKANRGLDVDFDDMKLMGMSKNIKVNENIGVKLSNRINSDINKIDRTEYVRSLKNKDKSDRATIEQVLDSRTSMILYKLVNKGEIKKFQGCLSTGKEANVYYSIGKEDKELAIKIYKTSILIFKDRDRYISGEFRFRHGYCKSNPRKMIALWAEKEVRNLRRIQVSGLRCPNPINVKSNIIILEFIGKDGIAAPRLRDADDLFKSYEKTNYIYGEIIRIMRKLFKECKLVHADFSEYNLLYYEGEIYVIDVAQAVEDDHPNSLEFLKRDVDNINNFFTKKNVNTITDQQFFDIVTMFDLGKSITETIEEFRMKNEEKYKEDKNFRERENGLFLNFTAPRTLVDKELDYINQNENVKNALTKMCGVIELDKEKEIEIKTKFEGKDVTRLIQDYNEEKDEVKKTVSKKENKQKLEKKDKQKPRGKKGVIEDDEDDRNTNSKNYLDENSLDDNDDEEDGEEDEEFEDEEDENEEEEEDDENENGEGKEGMQSQKEKKKKFDMFEGLTKEERKKKIKEDNKEKRQNKKMTKYEKKKKVNLGSHKNKRK